MVLTALDRCCELDLLGHDATQKLQLADGEEARGQKLGEVGNHFGQFLVVFEVGLVQILEVPIYHALDGTHVRDELGSLLFGELLLHFFIHVAATNQEAVESVELTKLSNDVVGNPVVKAL